MKNIVYILASVVLLGCSLTSCNEEILPEKENPTVNTADVPEGYMRVSFMPGDDVQTRGAVNDWVTTIYRVEALLYHDDEIMKFSETEDGNVLLNEDEGTSVKWPYTQKSYERTLKRGETYTIVYLGNIPEEKRTDIEKLSTAKIMAPDGNWNEWFNSNNMYYFFSKEFTVPTDEEQKTMTVDVMLRRLVSRHIIGGFGIAEGCDPGEGDYEDRYYESFLNENHPLGLGKKMFSGVESVMGQQFVRRLTMDFIFPCAYMLAEKYMEEGSILKTWWNENKDTYWSTYEEEGLNVDNLKQGWNVGNGNGWFNNTSGSATYDNKPKAVASLLNALLENKDGCMDALYENFKEGNIKKLENGVMTGPGSYTTTRQTIAEALKEALNGTALAAWNAGSQVSITLNKIPKTLSFGLETLESEENPQSANITIAEDADTKENNLTFLLLGTKSESAFGYSNLTADNLQLPSGDFPGQALTPNVSTSYRVYPEGEFSWDSMTDQYSDVYFSYKMLIEKFIELGLGSNLKYADWAAGGETTSGGPFYFALVPIYNISNTNQWEFDEEGQINYGSDKQFTIKVPVPDFSSMKDFSIKWEVDNGLGNSITE